MTTTDRICTFIESKLPRSFWDFHGESIRSFVEKEIEKSMESIMDVVIPPSDIATKLVNDLKQLAIINFADQSKVSPASMLEVVGGGQQSTDLSTLPTISPGSESPIEHVWHDVGLLPTEHHDVIAEHAGKTERCWVGLSGRTWFNANTLRTIPTPTRWRELTDKERASGV